MLAAYAVLKGVLNKDNHHQRRNNNRRQKVLRVVKPDIYRLTIANTHQLDIVLQKLDISTEWNLVCRGLIDNMAHHIRQLDNAALSTIGIDIYQRVDIVERIHQEVRIYLILEIIHLRLNILACQTLIILISLHRLVELLDTDICRKHKDTEHNVPIPRKVGKGRLMRQNTHISIAVRDNVPAL